MGCGAIKSRNDGGVKQSLVMMAKMIMYRIITMYMENMDKGIPMIMVIQISIHLNSSSNNNNNKLTILMIRLEDNNGSNKNLERQKMVI